MAREVEERRRREEEARFMAEQQCLREEKEAQERARAEQEENERLQRQVGGFSEANPQEASDSCFLHSQHVWASNDSLIF